MRQVEGQIQSITDFGSMYIFQIGYTQAGRVYVSKELFGRVFNTLPRVGSFIRVLVNYNDWVTYLQRISK